MAAARASSQVIDLVSSSEDEDDLQILDRPPRSVPATAFGNPDPQDLPEFEPGDAYVARLEDYGMGAAPGSFPNGIEDDQIFPQDPAEQERPRDGGEYQYFGDELVWIPDDSPPPSPVRQASPPAQEGANMRDFDYENAFPPLATAPVYNSDTCLQRVLEVFPDVRYAINVHCSSPIRLPKCLMLPCLANLFPATNMSFHCMQNLDSSSHPYLVPISTRTSL